MRKPFGFLFALCMGATGVLQLDAVAEDRWPVPDHYFGPDTVLFVDIDISDITLEKLQDSLHALFSKSKLQKYRVDFDPNVALAGVIKGLDAYRGLINFIRTVVEDPVSTVGDRIYIFLAVPEGGGESRLHGLIPVRKESAVETVLEYVGPRLKEHGLSVYMDLHYIEEKDRTDSWLVFSPKGTPRATQWSPARQKMLMAAMEKIERDPIRMVFRSNFALSDMAADAAKTSAENSGDAAAMAARDMVERLGKSKWLGIRMDVGSRPTLTINIELSSPGDALAVHMAYNNVLIPDLIKKAKKQDQEEKREAEEKDEEYDPKITNLQMAELIKMVFQMERNEALLTIKLNTDEIQELTAAVLATIERLFGNITEKLIEPFFGED